ncbi:MAG: DNA/RNA non-specific endonuclease [Chitinophagaceae bacterium]|nr:MAG: DNA/RNA non-specific endonuclease [Chitinophagaceae bacterium]
MNIRIISAIFMLLALPCFLFSQNIQTKLDALSQEYQQLSRQKDSLNTKIEALKLNRIIEKIHERGLPEINEGEEYICHSAMCILFSEEHSLAKWVVHILTGDIAEGRVGRSNDFRADPKISNTGVQEDYFLMFERNDGSIRYDGFGYDRGHLAPSADFRWSAKALSESYYYSNITPQTPEFNREKWTEIESFLRDYVTNNPENELYIVTAPVLEDDLPRLERGVNKLPIPEYHYKIAMDYDEKIGIAFLVPQEDLIHPIEWYAVTIDSIESLTGINFFASLTAEEEELIESQFDISKWYPEGEQRDIMPLRAEQLPRGAVNTIDAKTRVNHSRNTQVCGTIVSSHRSGNGNIFLNLDRRFPNQIFSVTIWARDVVNFDYEPEIYLKDKTLCFLGRVTESQGVPGMHLSTPKRIMFME